MKNNNLGGKRCVSPSLCLAEQGRCPVEALAKVQESIGSIERVSGADAVALVDNLVAQVKQALEDMGVIPCDAGIQNAIEALKAQLPAEQKAA